MQEQLDRLGVAFDWVEAVDAKEGDFAARLSEAGLSRNGPWGPMSHPTLACTLSHIKALRVVASGSSPFGLILEDDAKLSTQFARFSSADDWVPVGADVVRLEHWDDPKQIIALDKARHSIGHIDLQRLRSRTAGCAGYVVSRSFAQHLLARPEQINMPIDHVLFNFGASQLARSCVTYQMIPSVVVQDPAWGSDLAASLGSKQKLLQIKRGLYELRQGLSALIRVGLGSAEMRKNRFDT